MVIIILPTAFMTQSIWAVFPVHTIPFLSFSTPFFGREKPPRGPLASGKQFFTWTSNPLKQRIQEQYQAKDFLLYLQGVPNLFAEKSCLVLIILKPRNV